MPRASNAALRCRYRRSACSANRRSSILLWKDDVGPARRRRPSGIRTRPNILMGDGSSTDRRLRQFSPPSGSFNNPRAHMPLITLKVALPANGDGVRNRARFGNACSASRCATRHWRTRSRIPGILADQNACAGLLSSEPWAPVPSRAWARYICSPPLKFGRGCDRAVFSIGTHLR